ncbi:MAG: hypothetical protein AB9834_13865 [Lentimicrobium sp.]
MNETNNQRTKSVMALIPGKLKPTKPEIIKDSKGLSRFSHDKCPTTDQTMLPIFLFTFRPSGAYKNNTQTFFYQRHASLRLKFVYREQLFQVSDLPGLSILFFILLFALNRLFQIVMAPF